MATSFLIGVIYRSPHQRSTMAQATELTLFTRASELYELIFIKDYLSFPTIDWANTILHLKIDVERQILKAFTDTDLLQLVKVPTRFWEDQLLLYTTSCYIRNTATKQTRWTVVTKIKLTIPKSEALESNEPSWYNFFRTNYGSFREELYGLWWTVFQEFSDPTVYCVNYDDYVEILRCHSPLSNQNKLKGTSRRLYQSKSKHGTRTQNCHNRGKEYFF